MLVSLGADGALLVAGRRSTAIRAPHVEAVDTVGAGDTLNGALAAGLAAGLDLAEAARRAVVAASLAVTRAGAREGMPTAAELAAALPTGLSDARPGRRRPVAQSSPATQAVRSRAAGVISSRAVVGDPPGRQARAGAPRGRCRPRPPMNSVFDQTSAQAGSGPATVTARRPPSAGSPVRGSRR